MTCQKNRSTKQKAIRQTWFKNVPYDVSCVFYEGGYPKAERRSRDQVFLNCGDAYEDLAEKTYRFLSFCISHFEFDFIFKCDDDTYVHIPRLLACGFEQHDYLGNKPPGIFWKDGMFAQGGAYFLSKRAVQAILSFPFEFGRTQRWWWGGLKLQQGIEGAARNHASAEDIMVGDILSQRGIPLHIDARFLHDPYPCPYDDETQITSHHVAPTDMFEIHKKKDAASESNLSTENNLTKDRQ